MTRPMRIQDTNEGIDIYVPDWVVDLESFRRWSDHDDFPETGQISYLMGEVWIDMSKEQLFTHANVKTTITAILWALVTEQESGLYWGDGPFVSNEEGDVSNQPDGVFVSNESVEKGRVRIVEGKDEGHVELEGSPDMVLEVVSRSSVGKDTEVLREAYAKAGIREYWLVDARKEPTRFDILRLSKGKYVSARPRAGWTRSEVFDRFFRLTHVPGPKGFPVFTLEVRADKPT